MSDVLSEFIRRKDYVGLLRRLARENMALDDVLGLMRKEGYEGHTWPFLASTVSDAAALAMDAEHRAETRILERRALDEANPMSSTWAGLPHDPFVLHTVPMERVQINEPYEQSKRARTSSYQLEGWVQNRVPGTVLEISAGIELCGFPMPLPKNTALLEHILRNSVLRLKRGDAPISIYSLSTLAGRRRHYCRFTPPPGMFNQFSFELEMMNLPGGKYTIYPNLYLYWGDARR